MKRLVVVIAFLHFGCYKLYVKKPDPKLFYTFSIENATNYGVVIQGFLKNKRYDEITIGAGKTFEKKIVYYPNELDPALGIYHDPQSITIFSKEQHGYRDSISIVFENKRYLPVTYGTINKFTKLQEYPANHRPANFIGFYNVIKKGMNFGTYKICITENDYESAQPL